MVSGAASSASMPSGAPPSPGPAWRARVSGTVRLPSSFLMISMIPGVPRSGLDHPPDDLDQVVEEPLGDRLVGDEVPGEDRPHQHLADQVDVDVVAHLAPVHAGAHQG